MPTVYKYTPYVVAGPNGTTVRHNNTDEETPDIVTLCELNGEVYLSVPDGVTIPTQPAEITLTPVTITAELRSQLKAASRAVMVSKTLTRVEIEEAAGDLADQVADLEKRVAMSERLLYRMASVLLENNQIPTTMRDAYLPFVQTYVDAIDNGTATARSDIEPLEDIMNSGIQRSTVISQKVAEHITRIDNLIPRP